MYYELTLLLKEDEKGIPALWDSLATTIEKQDAVIEKRGLPLMKTLAYSMKYKDSSINHVYVATMYIKPRKEASVFLKALDETLSANGQIVRTMITKTSHIPEEKSMVLAKTASRERGKAAMDAKAIESLRAEESHKEEKPSLEQLDKKLEEILDDKIGF